MLARRTALTLPFLALLSACSPPVEVTASNRDGAYDKRLSRVLVVVALRRASLTESQNEALLRDYEIRQALSETWTPLDIAFEVVGVRVAQQPEHVRTSFPATQVLLLQLSWTSASLFSIAEYAIDASIVDNETGKRIWRARINFARTGSGGRVRSNPLGGAITHQLEANDFVKALTAKLKADGLLPQGPP